MYVSIARSPLEVSELLEQVLLHLSQSDILQLQQVSRFWLDTISGSPSIQQKLFFQPLPASKAAERPLEFNPLVQGLFPFLFEPHPCLGGWLVKEEAQETVQHWVRNPARRQAVLRPEASWRRMLPVQPAAPIDGFVVSEPPLTYDATTLEWCEVDPSRHASTTASASDQGGNATAGLLYDIVLGHLASPGGPAVYVQWNMVKFTRDLCYLSPRRGEGVWGFLNADDHVAFGMDWAEYYEGLRPRNTITIHAMDSGVSPATMSGTRTVTGACMVYAAVKMIVQAIVLMWTGWNSPQAPPTDSTDLGMILDLPAGVVRRGDKANQYLGASFSPAYRLWGKLETGSESELERERRKSAKDGRVA